MECDVGEDKVRYNGASGLSKYLNLAGYPPKVSNSRTSGSCLLNSVKLPTAAVTRHPSPLQRVAKPWMGYVGQRGGRTSDIHALDPSYLSCTDIQTRCENTPTSNHDHSRQPIEVDPSNPFFRCQLSALDS
jgi:hypothetical protein